MSALNCQPIEWPFKAGEWSLADEGHTFRQHVNVLIENEGDGQALTLVRESRASEGREEVDHYLRIDDYEAGTVSTILIKGGLEIERITAALQRVDADLRASVAF